MFVNILNNGKEEPTHEKCSLRITNKKIHYRYFCHILHICFAPVDHFDCSCSAEFCTRSNFPMIQVVVTIDEEEGVSPPRVTPPRWVFVSEWLVGGWVWLTGWVGECLCEWVRIFCLKVFFPGKSAQAARSRSSCRSNWIATRSTVSRVRWWNRSITIMCIVIMIIISMISIAIIKMIFIIREHPMGLSRWAKANHLKVLLSTSSRWFLIDLLW